MNSDLAAKLANYLLEVKAVQLSPDDPFTWTSGIRAPIYCDNRVLLSFPEIRTFIKNSLMEAAGRAFSDAGMIAGVATAGIAHGALLADGLELPFCYVRPEPKKHGLKNQIEGRLVPEQPVLVVEDLISTGKSSLAAVDALEAAGATVHGMLALFSYNFPDTRKRFEERNIRLHTLTDLDHLLPVAAAQGYIHGEQMESIHRFIDDPQGWWNS
jgi:orotate phosphoribosyltransferase